MQTTVEPDAEPAAMTHVRRHEEPLRIGLDEHRLHSRRRGAPEREPTVTVMVRQHHDERTLAANEERGVESIGKDDRDVAARPDVDERHVGVTIDAQPEPDRVADAIGRLVCPDFHVEPLALIDRAVDVFAVDAHASRFPLRIGQRRPLAGEFRHLDRRH